MIDHLGQTVHPVGLRSGSRVGPRFTALDREAVSRPWTGGDIGGFPPAIFELGHGSATSTGHKVETLFSGCPDPEAVHPL